MKRVFAIALFAVAIGIGAHANAQKFDVEKANAGAGIIAPDSFWYRHDLFYEEAWQYILGGFGDYGRKAQLSYIEKRIKEREAEAWEMITAKKSALSDEAIRVLGLKQDYRAQAKTIAVSGQDDERIKAIEMDGRKFDAEYATYVAKELDDAASAKKQVRDEIAAARKAGNIGELADLAKRSKEAQRKEANLLARNAQYVGTSEMISELLENTITGAQKAELILHRAAQSEEAKTATDERWKKLLKDLDATKKAVADGKTKELDDLTKNLQKSIRDVRITNNKQAVTERVKQNLKDEKATAPQEVKKPVAPPPPPAPKPELKPIPSETVNTEPLVLTYYENLPGEVGTYLSVNYSATGGLPPYHFQLETGTGFPPIGIILDVNGRLSGTPKTAGTSRFGVCVVDTAGTSICKITTMPISPAPQAPPPPPEPAPQPPPPPPPPEIEAQISITNTSCAIRERYSDGSSNYWVDVSGTASGPVGTTIREGDNGVMCGSWGQYTASICRREIGQPQETQWTFRFSSFSSGSTDQIYVNGMRNGEYPKSVTFPRHCP